MRATEAPGLYSGGRRSGRMRRWPPPGDRRGSAARCRRGRAANPIVTRHAESRPPQMSSETPATRPDGEIVVYEAPDGGVSVDVRLGRETVWLTQRQMAEVFRTSTDNVGLHLRKIFADNELEESATTEDLSEVQTEGQRRVRRTLKHYDLDAIISVGYQVNSKRACASASGPPNPARPSARRQYRTGRAGAHRRLCGHLAPAPRVRRRPAGNAARSKAVRWCARSRSRHPGHRRKGLDHRLNPEALTALTLLIAESAPAGKDLMVRLIVNLLAEPAG